MAIRFRKSIKVAPGLRLNISKSGVSTSVGGKGLTANVSKRGVKTTASIPGTGLSASTSYPARKRDSREGAGLNATGWAILCLIGLVLVVLILK
ncbi:DUF4236 domain-containing protein [Pseudomonas aeruginosa]|uniref:DUF4236 domain-containing protein n=1 Tax=Pseudomonas aeruginosa TaxID=287 RepID=UPI00383AD11C